MTAKLSDVTLPLDTFPISVVRTRPVRAGQFLVQGSDADYVGHLEEIRQAEYKVTLTDCLAFQGFRMTERPVMNWFQERLIPMEGEQMFYLVPDFGTESLQASKEDARDAAKNLADLHDAWREAGISPIGPTRYQDWATPMTEGRRWLGIEEVMGWPATIPEPPELKSWLRRWGDYAKRAETALQQSNYEELSSQWLQEEGMAWGHYRLQNLRRSKGHVATLMAGLPVQNSPLFDLATLCYDLCLGGDAEAVFVCLNTYEKQRPMTDQERTIVLGYALYPHFSYPLVRKLRRGQTMEGAPVFQEAERHAEAAETIWNTMGMEG